MTTTSIPAAAALDGRAQARRLLGAGALAAPLFAVVIIAQGLTREGFNFSRHPASILSNGSLGSIQVANFLVTGLLITAGARGLARANPTGTGSRWAPRLTMAFGVGTALAGVFPMDPGDGFPVGTPEGPGTMSWHGGLHAAVSSLAFLSLVAASLVMARRYAAQDSRGWALYSAASGVLFLLGDVVSTATFSSSQTVAMASFNACIVIGLSWFTAMLLHERANA